MTNAAASEIQIAAILGEIEGRDVRKIAFPLVKVLPSHLRRLNESIANGEGLKFPAWQGI